LAQHIFFDGLLDISLSKVRQVRNMLGHLMDLSSSRTWREERAVDQFVVSGGVVLESPPITGEVPEQQLIESPSAREPHYKPERASSRPAEAFLKKRNG